MTATKRIIDRHMENPGKYQPPETFETLLSPAGRDFVLSGWGGVPAFPELEAEREAAGTAWLAKTGKR